MEPENNICCTPQQHQSISFLQTKTIFHSDNDSENNHDVWEVHWLPSLTLFICVQSMLVQWCFAEEIGLVSISQIAYWLYWLYLIIYIYTTELGWGIEFMLPKSLHLPFDFGAALVLNFILFYSLQVEFDGGDESTNCQLNCILLLHLVHTVKHHYKLCNALNYLVTKKSSTAGSG